MAFINTSRVLCTRISADILSVRALLWNCKIWYEERIRRCSGTNVYSGGTVVINVRASSLINESRKEQWLSVHTDKWFRSELMKQMIDWYWRWINTWTVWCGLLICVTYFWVHTVITCNRLTNFWHLQIFMNYWFTLTAKDPYSILCSFLSLLRQRSDGHRKSAATFLPFLLGNDTYDTLIFLSYFK